MAVVISVCGDATAREILAFPVIRSNCGVFCWVAIHLAILWSLALRWSTMTLVPLGCPIAWLEGLRACVNTLGLPKDRKRGIWKGEEGRSVSFPAECMDSKLVVNHPLLVGRRPMCIPWPKALRPLGVPLLPSAHPILPWHHCPPWRGSSGSPVAGP